MEDRTWKWGRWAALFAVVCLLFWFPLTRAAILYILPLGSGVDDLVFIGAGALALLAYSRYRAEGLRYMSRIRWTFLWTIGALILAVLLVLWVFGG